MILSMFYVELKKVNTVEDHVTEIYIYIYNKKSEYHCGVFNSRR